VTQVPIYNAVLMLQDVQFVVIKEQVKQAILHKSQLLVIELLIVILTGHILLQVELYKKNPVAQLKHDDIVVQVAQGDTQITQITYVCVVSGYIPEIQEVTQILVVAVLFKYGKVEVELQVRQLLSEVWQVRQLVLQITHCNSAILA
jgi:hypothetical protein